MKGLFSSTKKQAGGEANKNNPTPVAKGGNILSTVFEDYTQQSIQDAMQLQVEKPEVEDLKALLQDIEIPQIVLDPTPLRDSINPDAVSIKYPSPVSVIPHEELTKKYAEELAELSNVYKIFITQHGELLNLYQGFRQKSSLINEYIEQIFQENSKSLTIEDIDSRLKEFANKKAEITSIQKLLIETEECYKIKCNLTRLFNISTAIISGDDDLCYIGLAKFVESLELDKQKIVSMSEQVCIISELLDVSTATTLELSAKSDFIKATILPDLISAVQEVYGKYNNTLLPEKRKIIEQNLPKLFFYLASELAEVQTLRAMENFREYFNRITLLQFAIEFNKLLSNNTTNQGLDELYITEFNAKYRALILDIFSDQAIVKTVKEDNPCAFINKKIQEFINAIMCEQSDLSSYRSLVAPIISCCKDLTTQSQLIRFDNITTAKQLTTVCANLVKIADFNQSGIPAAFVNQFRIALDILGDAFGGQLQPHEAILVVPTAPETVSMVIDTPAIFEISQVYTASTELILKSLPNSSILGNCSKFEEIPGIAAMSYDQNMVMNQAEKGGAEIEVFGEYVSPASEVIAQIVDICVRKVNAMQAKTSESVSFAGTFQFGNHLVAISVGTEQPRTFIILHNDNGDIKLIQVPKYCDLNDSTLNSDGFKPAFVVTGYNIPLNDAVIANLYFSSKEVLPAFVARLSHLGATKGNRRTCFATAAATIMAIDLTLVTYSAVSHGDNGSLALAIKEQLASLPIAIPVSRSCAKISFKPESFNKKKIRPTTLVIEKTEIPIGPKPISEPPKPLSVSENEPLAEVDGDSSFSNSSSNGWSVSASVTPPGLTPTPVTDYDPLGVVTSSSDVSEASSIPTTPPVI